jgi:NAD(P)-dependent dehydrogenase (short-subunit alcohol dehydrogenase family)
MAPVYCEPLTFEPTPRRRLGSSRAASKGGVDQLVRTLAAERARHHIRVNAVAPGYVVNIVAGVTALASPASYVTGCIIAVDGGYAAT